MWSLDLPAFVVVACEVANGMAPEPASTRPFTIEELAAAQGVKPMESTEEWALLTLNRKDFDDFAEHEGLVLLDDKGR